MRTRSGWGRRPSAVLPLLSLAMVQGCSTSQPAGSPATSPSSVAAAEHSSEAGSLSGPGFVVGGQEFVITCEPFDEELVKPTPFATAAPLPGTTGLEADPPPVHEVAGADPQVLVAVSTRHCDPDGQGFDLASARSETSGGRPTEALKRAWCSAAPAQANGFDWECPDAG